MIQYTFYFTEAPDDSKERIALAKARDFFGETVSVRYVAVSNALYVTLPQEAEASSVAAFIQALESVGLALKAEPILRTVEQELMPSLPTASPQKSPRRVPMSVFISSLCVLLVLSVLATFSVASEIFNRALLDWQEQQWDTPNASAPTDHDDLPTDVGFYTELAVLQFLFEQYALEEIDDEAVAVAVLKAYAAGTGDIFAAYYTEEELLELDAESQGEMQGIGVSVVDDAIELNGMTYNVLTVISVYNDSPALAADIRVGDHIYAVIDDDDEVHSVTEIGYDAALACVRGVADTNARFTVVRMNESGYEVIPFEITRAAITTQSVTGRVLDADPSIGLVKISQFDFTTPPQFHTVMDSLIAQGCTKFIFDLRHNPGGILESVEAVLSTLLQENDVMISTVYKSGAKETARVRAITYTREGYEGCSVTTEDIGKYRGYSFAVLTNQYTASAAELFSSNLRDYELATLVGVKTYGKGIMQSTFDLSYFGIEGALKLTVAWYQPPSGENYHGVGIAPHIEIDMDKQTIKKYGNIYLIPDAEDAQLMAAVQALQ